MKTRRMTFKMLAVWFLGSQVKAQPATNDSVRELARRELTGSQAGMEAILLEVTAQPGAPSTAHRHSGFVLGYVLDGAMAFAINGETPRVVEKGGTFFEPIDALHTKGNSAKPDSPVTFLAFIVAPKGKPIVMPA